MNLQRINKDKLKYIFLLSVGLSLIFAGINKYYYERVLSFDYTPTQHTPYDETSKLESIRIERFGLDLDVQDSSIVDGVWQISGTRASHLASSAVPGENDNIVIYAHNKKHLFGALPFVKTGDIITVITSDTITHRYEVKQTFTVSPNNIEPVLPTEKEILTLYTCTGLLDSKRFIVKATPT